MEDPRLEGLGDVCVIRGPAKNLVWPPNGRAGVLALYSTRDRRAEYGKVEYLPTYLPRYLTYLPT